MVARLVENVVNRVWRSFCLIVAMSGAAAAFAQEAVELGLDGPKLSAQSPWGPRAISARGLENLTAAGQLLSYVRFFHPSDQTVGVAAWDHFAVSVMDRAEPASDAGDLARRLTEAFQPIAPTLEVWAGGADEAPPVPAPSEAATHMRAWKHAGVSAMPSEHRSPVYRSEVERLPLSDGQAGGARPYAIKTLGGGVSCRLPVKCYADDTGAIPHGTAPEEWRQTDAQPTLIVGNRSTRLAGVALAWGVMQHFHPYLEEAGTEWKEALPVALAKAAIDADETAYLNTLREMIAKLRDGHAEVSKRSSRQASFLPLALEWAGDDLVVVGSHASVGRAVRPGDVVVSIDGRSAEECLGEVSRSISAATEGHMRVQSIHRIMIDLATGDPVRITLRHPDGAGYSILPRRVREWPASQALKPVVNGAEVVPGIVYFNLIGATAEQLHESMTKLESAQGIIFDVRGYPGEAAVELMSHLTDSPIQSPRWVLPVFRLPDREGVEWLDLERWLLPAKPPRLNAEVAFLADARAISFAESILGIVAHYKLGDIVGSTTAGTNGDINSFTAPGGHLVSWSGLKVLKHDGGRHHGVGVAATVPVVPTPAGIAAGRDEVLDKAVEVLRAGLASGPQP